MRTSSAQRSTAPSPSGPPLGWIAVGLGAFLILASFYLQFAGSTAWSGTLEPASQEDGISAYITPDVLLEPGTYDLHLSYRQPPRMLEITTGRYRVLVTSTELPGWRATGFLKKKRRRGATAIHSMVQGDVVAHVPNHLQAPLRLEVQGAGDAYLSVTIRGTRVDYRIPLWAGVAFVALGLAFDPSVRSRLQGLLGRS